jgi:hypothetical protein
MPLDMHLHHNRMPHDTPKKNKHPGISTSSVQKNKEKKKKSNTIYPHPQPQPTRKRKGGVVSYILYFGFQLLFSGSFVVAVLTVRISVFGHCTSQECQFTIRPYVICIYIYIYILYFLCRNEQHAAGALSSTLH